MPLITGNPNLVYVTFPVIFFHFVSTVVTSSLRLFCIICDFNTSLRYAVYSDYVCTTIKCSGLVAREKDGSTGINLRCPMRSKHIGLLKSGFVCAIPAVYADKKIFFVKF